MSFRMQACLKGCREIAAGDKPPPYESSISVGPTWRHLSRSRLTLSGFDRPSSRRFPGSRLAPVFALALAFVFAAGCGRLHPGTDDGGALRADGGDPQGSGADGGFVTCSDAQLQALEQELGAALDVAGVDPSISTQPNFTLLLERSDGRSFTHSHGASTPTTSYESASTSKWVSAAVILNLVDEGKLSLDDTANHWLPGFWAESSVTLRHLLSFTSGFSDEPLCINLPGSDLQGCVNSIYTKNAASHAAAGSQFFYSSAHLQVAGLMAMRSMGPNASWAEVFAAFQAKTGLFPTSKYDLPSATNPRLAGGMHWTGAEYLDFLRALSKGTLLTSATRAQLFANQRGSATVAQSPVVDAMHEDWAYGFGNWLECPTAKTPASFDCGGGHRNSSPGAYGAYPFIDFDHQYFGILARQGKLGTYPEGLLMFRAVEAKVTRWAQNRCAP